MWGIGNIDAIERIQLNFYIKSVLNLKHSTPSNVVYGERGIMPLYIDTQTRIVSFWTKLARNAENKISSTVTVNVHRLFYEMHNLR